MFFSKFSQIALHTQNKLSFLNRSCPTAISPALNTELARCPSSDLNHGGSKTHSNSGPKLVSIGQQGILRKRTDKLLRLVVEVLLELDSRERHTVRPGWLPLSKQSETHFVGNNSPLRQPETITQLLRILRTPIFLEKLVEYVRFVQQ